VAVGAVVVAGVVGSSWLQAGGSEPVARVARTSGAETRVAAAGTAGAAAAATRISIAWVGDITPGSSYGLPPDGGRPLFASVRSWLRAPDLTFGNLEGTLSVGGGSKCGAGGPNCFAFQAPPENGRTLRWAGFDVMNLANNHSFDFGPQGQAQTVAALRAARVRFTGRPGEIRVVSRRGVRVGLVGFAPYPWAASLNDIPRARRLVAAAGRRADVVVAFIHAGAEGADQMRTPWGTEFAFGEDRGDTRAFAHAAVDAGADLVLGSGPHVIRGVERYRGRLIAYSLGNFAGWDNFPGGGALSLSGIFRVTLRRDGVPTAGRWLPVRLVGPGTPEADPTKASALVAAQLSRDDFAAAAGLRPNGRVSVPRRSARR
jgi:hypothetical protein